MSDLRDATPVERVRMVVTEVVEVLELDGAIVVEEREEEIVATVEGEDLGLLIGKHGQTIDALQHLLSRIAYRGESGRKRVVADAAGYRERRAEALRGQADRAAGDALRSGRPVALDAMVPSERRIVHEYLRDNHEVETFSEGDDPDRHLVVAPVAAP